MRRRVLLVAGIALVAFNLRPAIASVGPLLTLVRDRSGLSSADAGLLTTLPVLCFGILSPAVPALVRRFGAGRTILVSLVVLTAGIGLRSLPGLVTLFAGTLLIGLGIAVGNVALPGVVKHHFPDHAGLMTGVYTTALSAGAAVAAGLTVPLHDVTRLGWQGTLALWGVLAALAAVAWLPQARRDRGRSATIVDDPGTPVLPLREADRGIWRQPLAWQLTMFMGLQSLNFYAMLAWMPTLFHAHGMSAERGGFLLSVAGFSSLLTTFTVPVLAARARDQRALVSGCVLVCLAAFVLLLIAPVGAAYPAVILLGLGQGAAIGLSLTLMVLRAPDAHLASELSGMAQSVGYLVAALGPLVVGALAGATGGWTWPVVLLAVLLVPEWLVGLGAARNIQVNPGVSGPRSSVVAG